VRWSIDHHLIAVAPSSPWSADVGRWVCVSVILMKFALSQSIEWRAAAGASFAHPINGEERQPASTKRAKEAAPRMEMPSAFLIIISALAQLSVRDLRATRTEQRSTGLRMYDEDRTGSQAFLNQTPLPPCRPT
jgi:hypothetical protein